jgi:predicted nicotinamide N-methyase
MTDPPAPAETLATTAGDFPLHTCRVAVGGRAWTVLHTGAILTHDDEARFLAEQADRVPYGVALWPAGLALAHEVATRADALRGRTVLELGAGTGLPGLVAASLGASVVQTDRHEVALAVCRRNGARNGVAAAVTYRLADWSAWADPARYDVILGADILYAESQHAHLRHILTTNLAPAGRVLLADPFRAEGYKLLEALQAEGWHVGLTKWEVGAAAAPRAVGVFELTPPRV